jgi:arylsulfatase A-like enzyme
MSRLRNDARWGVIGRMRILPVLAAWIVVSCGAPESKRVFEPGAKKPNVLIVLADVLRRDHLGVYGYAKPTSPRIDAFAEESHRFSSAYSHSTWTKPSVASLFTSVYPEDHGIESDASFHTEVLPESLETLAERFQASGHLTVSVGANLHIQRKTGFAQGFDSFSMRRSTNAYDLNTMFIDWLDARDSDRPFFGYVHYMDVHWPYTRRRSEEGTRLGDTRLEEEPPNRRGKVADWAAEFLDDKGLAALVARYDYEIAYLDDAFGVLIDALEERMLLDETIVVFLADHGEEFYEHGKLQHGFSPWPEVTAIPLLIRLPPAWGLESGPIDSVVGLVDVMPTLLELVGVEPPAYTRGRSLVPLLLRERLRERPVYLIGPEVRALRGPNYSLFEGADSGLKCFDRSTDPQELSPLTGELPAACGRMEGTLGRLVQGFERLGSRDLATATIEFDQEEIEALKALGYVD